MITTMIFRSLPHSLTEFFVLIATQRPSVSLFCVDVGESAQPAQVTKTLYDKSPPPGAPKLWRLDGKVTRSRLWLKWLPKLKLWNSMARSQAPGFGWNDCQNSRFEDSMARSPAAALVKTDKTCAKTQASRLWLKYVPKLKLWRLDGKVTRSRLWLTYVPKLKLRRLDCQNSMKTQWQGHPLKALVETCVKTQASKTRWQGHSHQALVEMTAKTQALKTRWQGHSHQALVEMPAKTQALKTRWQGHPLQALVETYAKTQALKLDGKVTSSRLWLKWLPKLTLRRLDGKVTSSRLWLKWLSKLTLRRLDGKVHPFQALVNICAKTPASKTRWQGHLLQAWVEMTAKTQALKTRWQGHQLQALVETNAKLKLWRLDGKVTCSRLWLKQRPKLKVARPRGRWRKYSRCVAPSRCVTPSSTNSLSQFGSLQAITPSCIHISWIQLVCKCRTALRFFRKSLGLPSLHSVSVFHSHDARRALRLACMKDSLTPSCAGQTHAWSNWRSVSLLLQSNTEPEARPYQFHLHLCQLMHVAILCTPDIGHLTGPRASAAERSSTLKANIEPADYFWPFPSVAKCIPTPFLRGSIYVSFQGCCLIGWNPFRACHSHSKL